MLCHCMSCHVISFHVISCHVISCHVISCHVIWSHVSSTYHQLRWNWRGSLRPCLLLRCIPLWDDRIFGLSDHSCIALPWICNHAGLYTVNRGRLGQTGVNRDAELEPGEKGRDQERNASITPVCPTLPRMTVFKSQIRELVNASVRLQTTEFCFCFYKNASSSSSSSFSFSFSFSRKTSHPCWR